MRYGYYFKLQIIVVHVLYRVGVQKSERASENASKQFNYKLYY